jgi:hypothetical protein
MSLDYINLTKEDKAFTEMNLALRNEARKEFTPFPTCETYEHIDYTREVIGNDQLIVCREYGVVLNDVRTTHFCACHQDFQK